MSNGISTDSGHYYDLDDVQSGLRYIAEQVMTSRYPMPVPSHVLALVYNAIYHIQSQKLEIELLHRKIAHGCIDQPCSQCDKIPPV